MQYSEAVAAYYRRDQLWYCTVEVTEHNLARDVYNLLTEMNVARSQREGIGELHSHESFENNAEGFGARHPAHSA